MIDHDDDRPTPDQDGNRYAEEGVTRCDCGCKYWRQDRCIDCGEDAPGYVPAR